MSVFWMIVIFLIVGSIISGISTQNKHAKFEEISKEFKGVVTYNKIAQTLTVKTRSHHLKKALITREYMENNYGYTVEKVKTGKVQLYYYYYNPNKKVKDISEDKYIECNLVKKIKLSEDLLEKAKTSPISKYLVNDTIIVQEKVDEQKLKGALLTANQLGDWNMAGNFSECAKTQTMPTKEKCDAIIAWLSTCD